MLKWDFWLHRIWNRLATGIAAEVTNTVDVNVQNFPTSFEVSNFPAFPNNFAVNNFPAGFNVNNFPANFGINNFPAGFNVNNFPANQTVNGAVSVTNFPAFPAGFNVNNFPAVQDVRIIKPDSGNSTKMDFVHTSPALNPLDVYTILTYTVPAGKTLVLDFIKFSSALDFKAEISINGQECYNEFGEGSRPSPEYKRSRPFAAGTVFEFKLTNRAAPLSAATSIYVTMAGDLY